MFLCCILWYLGDNLFWFSLHTLKGKPFLFSLVIWFSLSYISLSFPGSMIQFEQYLTFFSLLYGLSKLETLIEVKMSLSLNLHVDCNCNFLPENKTSVISNLIIEILFFKSKDWPLFFSKFLKWVRRLQLRLN